MQDNVTCDFTKEWDLATSDTPKRVSGVDIGRWQEGAESHPLFIKVPICSSDEPTVSTLCILARQRPVCAHSPLPCCRDPKINHTALQLSLFLVKLQLQQGKFHASPLKHQILLPRPP